MVSGSSNIEPIPIAGSHAQHLGDHDDRQRTAERSDQVESVLSGDPVQELRGDLPHSCGEPRDGPGRERLGDQQPQSGVLGRVDVEQAQRDGLDEDAIGVAETPVIAQHRLHVAVPGQGPGVGQATTASRGHLYTGDGGATHCSNGTSTQCMVEPPERLSA